MTLRTGIGWQYALADLSLILFMVAAQGLSKTDRTVSLPRPAAVTANVPALADPVAIWRPAPQMPSLKAWLASQPHDPRQRLTIVAHYSSGSAAKASAQAAHLLDSADTASAPVRLLIEPGPDTDISAALTWDAAPASLNGSKP